MRILQWEMTHNDPLFKSFHYEFIAFTIWIIYFFLLCHLHSLYGYVNRSDM